MVKVPIFGGEQLRHLPVSWAQKGDHVWVELRSCVLDRAALERGGPGTWCCGERAGLGIPQISRDLTINNGDFYGISMGFSMGIQVI